MKQVGTKLEILILENNLASLEAIRKGLGQERFEAEFTVCQTGTGALQFLEGFVKTGIRKSPNAIVMEMDLPGIHGLEILEAIRTDEKLNAIPVIVYTSSDKVDYLLAAKKWSNVTYLRKGFEGIQELSQAVSEAILPKSITLAAC